MRPVADWRTPCLLPVPASFEPITWDSPGRYQCVSHSGHLTPAIPLLRPPPSICCFGIYTTFSTLESILFSMFLHNTDPPPFCIALESSPYGYSWSPHIQHYSNLMTGGRSIILLRPAKQLEVFSTATLSQILRIPAMFSPLASMPHSPAPSIPIRPLPFPIVHNLDHVADQGPLCSLSPWCRTVNQQVQRGNRPRGPPLYLVRGSSKLIQSTNQLNA